MKYFEKANHLLPFLAYNTDYQEAKMKITNLPKKTWQKIYDFQILFCLLAEVLLMVSGLHNATKTKNQVTAIILLVLFLALTVYVQKMKVKDKFTYEFTRWLNLLFGPGILCTFWLKIGNLLLVHLPQIEIIWVLLLWAVLLGLLLPIAMVYAAQIKNWFLRLLIVFLLNIQYGLVNTLKVSRSLKIMHSLTGQGVIAAISLFILACFLGKAWGFRFNPNLKFNKSQNFQQVTFVLLILFTLLDLFYNCFNAYSKDIWTVFFRYNFNNLKFSLPNLTCAIEPGILEETVRYLNIIILLAGFNHLPKWRVPIAIYGSTLLFGLAHLGNVGWHGATLSATIMQAIGVTGCGFLWAVLYLYTGKLWPAIVAHFISDFVANMLTGWNSSGWHWHGYATDYIYTILIVGVPLLFSIWMMSGKARQVMEENADRIMNVN